MSDLTFDHLYPYAELTEALHTLAAAHPELLDLATTGQSHEGRDIWIATITNGATGPHDEKPALVADARPQVASAARASGFVLQSADVQQVSYLDSQ